MPLRLPDTLSYLRDAFALCRRACIETEFKNLFRPQPSPELAVVERVYQEIERRGDAEAVQAWLDRQDFGRAPRDDCYLVTVLLGLMAQMAAFGLLRPQGALKALIDGPPSPPVEIEKIPAELRFLHPWLERLPPERTEGGIVELLVGMTLEERGDLHRTWRHLGRRGVRRIEKWLDTVDATEPMAMRLSNVLCLLDHAGYL